MLLLVGVSVWWWCSLQLCTSWTNTCPVPLVQMHTVLSYPHKHTAPTPPTPHTSTPNTTRNRFYQELDFPWSLPPQLVVALVPRVVDIVTQEVARVYADQVPAGVNLKVGGLWWGVRVQLLSWWWWSSLHTSCWVKRGCRSTIC